MIKADLNGKRLVAPKKVPTMGLIILSNTTDNNPYTRKKLISMYLYPFATASLDSVAPIFPRDAVIALGKILVKLSSPAVIIW